MIIVSMCLIASEYIGKSEVGVIPERSEIQIYLPTPHESPHCFNSRCANQVINVIYSASYQGFIFVYTTPLVLYLIYVPMYASRSRLFVLPDVNTTTMPPTLYIQKFQNFSLRRIMPSHLYIIIAYNHLMPSLMCLSVSSAHLDFRIRVASSDLNS